MKMYSKAIFAAFLSTALTMCLNFPSATKAAPASVKSPAPPKEAPQPSNDVEMFTVESQSTQFVITSVSASDGLFKYSCGMASKIGPDGNLTLERDPRLDASAHFFTKSAVVIAFLGEAPTIFQLLEDYAIIVCAPADSLPVSRACRINEDTGLFENCRSLEKSEQPHKAITSSDLRTALSNITKYCDGVFSQNVQGNVDPKTVDGFYSPARMGRLADSHSNFRAVTVAGEP